MTRPVQPASSVTMAPTGPIQAVVFMLASETFALPVATVREILDYRPASRVPEGPNWLLGLIDVRGTAVPLIDLHVRLGFAAAEPTESSCVLVTEVRDESGRAATLGLLVDRVVDVASFAADEIGAPPEIGMEWEVDYVAGLVRRDGGFVLLLDPTRLSFQDAMPPLPPATPS